MKRLTDGQVRSDLQNQIKMQEQSPSTGVSSSDFGMARVVSVNSKEMQITLKVFAGLSQESRKAPVNITLPGAGKRSFFGRFPEEGDIAVVGWLTQNSGGGSKIPTVVAWVPPSSWVAQDWHMVQDFSPDEIDMTPKAKAEMAGMFDQVRHKMRHMNPGNIVASSSQGADLVLDESVLLTNRRATEIQLRDQDQAIVMRGVSQFTVSSGSRTYTGPVQREASLLPRQMFSTSADWAGFGQLDSETGNVVSPEIGFVSDTAVGTEDETDDGSLSPGSIFFRNEGEDTPKSGFNVPGRLDPYDFLQKGLFVDSTGSVVDPDSTFSEAVYGGKPLFRVSVDANVDGRSENANLGNHPALSEHRVEVFHTSDLTLPVSEQTEGFDADRHEDSEPPIVEFVLGSVVGNDLYNNRQEYGIPLKTQIFPSPKMVPAIGSPLEEHAAYMVRVQPPEEADSTFPTFWTVAKGGDVGFSFGSDLEGSINGDSVLASEGSLDAYFRKGFRVRAKRGNKSNLGISLTSDEGAVRVYGGGQTSTGAVGAAKSPEGSSSLPSLSLEGKTNVVVKAGRDLTLSGSKVTIDSDSVEYRGMSDMLLGSGGSLDLQGKDIGIVSSGKMTEMYTGPKDAIPANGALRSVQFSATPATGNVGGVVDEYVVQFGDRSETFVKGSHETSITVGDMTYQTAKGFWEARAAANTLKLQDTSGLSAEIQVGNVSLNSSSGSATMSGRLAASVRSSTGKATVSGMAGARLGGPGAKVGGIVSASDLDPLTGAPLGSYGMGSLGHKLETHS